MKVSDDRKVQKFYEEHMKETTVQKAKYQIHMMEKVRLATRVLYGIFIWYEFVMQNDDYFNGEVEEQL